MSHDYGLKCERCGAWMDLHDSVMGGMCHKCRDKLEEKRPPDVAVQHAPEMRDKRGNILLRAHEVINGERQDQYGQPEDCFSTIAALWSVWLGRTVTPQDVAVMMALLKIARMQHGAGHEDSFVDGAGYLALAADMAAGSADA